HERAAEVVGSCAKRGLPTLDAELDPGGLDVRYPRMEPQPRDGVHEERLAEGGAGARPSLEVDRRLHVHEGQRDELREAARAALLIAEGEQVPGPAPRALDVPVHDRRRRTEPDAVRPVV